MADDSTPGEGPVDGPVEDPTEGLIDPADGSAADAAAGSPETDVSNIELPPEHPAIAPLSFLLGRWKGTGKGSYPTIPSFDFFQEVTFSHIGKPYLIYTSRSWRLATDEQGELKLDEQGDPELLEPLAVEAGFWRPQPEGKVEVLLSHPTGITEIYAGEFRSMTSIEMVTDAVARTASAKPYTAGKRLYGLVPSQVREGEKDLAYAFDMAAMGQPLTPHLWAILHWDWIE
ncbi:MAG TPA: FABP family protein [Trebonia sp.]|jgi:hypothetical protein